MTNPVLTAGGREPRPGVWVSRHFQAMGALPLPYDVLARLQATRMVRLTVQMNHLHTRLLRGAGIGWRPYRTTTLEVLKGADEA